MSRITLEIPDNKLDFFMELVRNLGFVSLNKDTTEHVLSARQRELVDAEILKAKENPAYMLDWKTAQQQIDWDA